MSDRPAAPHGWKWELVPDYPVGTVYGPCVCGSWPGGECLKCAPLPGAPLFGAEPPLRPEPRRPFLELD